MDQGLTPPPYLRKKSIKKLFFSQESIPNSPLSSMLPLGRCVINQQFPSLVLETSEMMTLVILTSIRKIRMIRNVLQDLGCS